MSEAMPLVTEKALMMVNTLVVKPDDRDAYRAALQEALPQARELEGCLLLEVGESQTAPGTFVLTERWRSGREYVEEYLQLAFFKKYLAITEKMYAAPRSVVVLTAIPTK